MQFDVIIVGGSYAGLAAGMPLARARRKILVVDGGQRLNIFSDHSHVFLTQDGTEAAVIAQTGRAQLLAYNTVEWGRRESHERQANQEWVSCRNRRHGPQKRGALYWQQASSIGCRSCPGLPSAGVVMYSIALTAMAMG